MPFSLVRFPRGWVWFVKNSPLGYTQSRCTHQLGAVSGPFDEGDGQNAGTSEFCPPVIKRVNKKCVQHKTRQRASSTHVYIILQETFNLIRLVTLSMLSMDLLQQMFPPQLRNIDSPFYFHTLSPSWLSAWRRDQRIIRLNRITTYLTDLNLFKSMVDSCKRSNRLMSILAYSQLVRPYADDSRWE